MTCVLGLRTSLKCKLNSKQPFTRLCLYAICSSILQWRRSVFAESNSQFPEMHSAAIRVSGSLMFWCLFVRCCCWNAVCSLRVKGCSVDWWSRCAGRSHMRRSPWQCLPVVEYNLSSGTYCEWAWSVVWVDMTVGVLYIGQWPGWPILNCCCWTLQEGSCGPGYNVSATIVHNKSAGCMMWHFHAERNTSLMFWIQWHEKQRIFCFRSCPN